MEEPHRVYIAVDVEASGASPGKYSMLALGACLVWQHETQFYREIKPISAAFYPDSIVKAAQGLHCVDEFHDQKINDPANPHFDPMAIINRLEEAGTPPREAIADFNEWVKRVSAGGVPVFVASPVIFHCMYLYWYFDNFNDGRNPVLHMNGYCLDLPSLVYGLRRNFTTLDRERVSYGTRHNALDDAIALAYEFEHYLKMVSGRDE